MLYDLFISYAHKDNQREQVRELCDAIAEDFWQFAGRELHVFFDEQAIASMADWEKRIAQGLRESRLFLAVLSPSYFASAYCRREWEEYVRYEAMRQCLGEGVAPVYFVRLPSLDNPAIEPSIADWIAELRKRQWCEILSWHDMGKRALEDTHVAQQLLKLKREMQERLSRADRARQSPTNIYRHNPQFVGRIRELTLLREALNEHGSVGVVGHTTRAAAASAGATAVHGLGGMGKTELALAYAHTFAWDYPGGRWLARCEGQDNFDLVLRQFAEPLGIEFTEDEQKDMHRAGERILSEFRRRNRSLLLLDNVTDPALLGPDVLMRLPSQDHVHLLATTRLGPTQLAGSPHDHTFVAVDELPDPDALALIRAHQPNARFANSNDEVAATQLITLLAGFTLAIETAAIYLGRHSVSGAIAAYTKRLGHELLAESEAVAADPSVAVRHKEKLLERTLAVTFEALNEEQLHILALASLLPADEIALPWLRAVASETFPLLKPGSASDIKWQQLADSLLSLRLLQPGDDVRVVRMHRLVQELRRQSATTAIASLEPALLIHIKSKAELLWEGWVQHEHRWELKPLAASARQWMERDNLDGAYLANQLFGPLHDLGNFAEAEALIQRALAIVEQSHGPYHPDVSASLNNLALLLQATNRLTEAEPLLHRALAIDEQGLGPDHLNVALSLNNLATLLQATNRQAEAEPLLRRTLAIVERSYGPDHPQAATSLNNLALLLQATNRLAEAEELIRRALAIVEQSFGPDHPQVAKAINGLIMLLQATNRLVEAEPLMRRALAIDEQVFGPDHLGVTGSLNNLVLLLQATNRLAEAEPLMRRALAIDEQSFGPDHLRVALSLNNLASLLHNSNRLAEAEPLMRRALAIDEQSFGPDHPDVAGKLNNLAVLLKTTNRFAEAEALMRRALAIEEQSFGSDHPEVARQLNNLASLLKATNRQAEAEPLLRRTLAIVERSYGPDHPQAATSLNNLALLLHNSNRLAEAEPLMCRALAIDEQSFGPDHPEVATCLNNLAMLLQATNRLTEAEPLLRRALAIDEQSHGPNHPDVARDLNNLALLLKATNRLTEAEPLTRRALAINEQSFGSDHPEVARRLNNLASLLKETNRRAEAEPLLRRALAIDEQSFGPNHPDTARDLNNLASLLYDSDRLAEAEPLMRRALAIDEQSFGPDHPKVALSLNNLATLCQETNRLTEAEPLMRRVIEIFLRFTLATSHQHPHLQAAISNYAALLHKIGYDRRRVRAELNKLGGPFGMQFR